MDSVRICRTGFSARVLTSICCGFRAMVLATRGPLLCGLSREPHIVAAAPAIYEQVLISRGPRARGAVLKGMIPAYERKVSDLLSAVKIGSAAGLEENTPASGSEGSTAEKDFNRQGREENPQRTQRTSADSDARAPRNPTSAGE